MATAETVMTHSVALRMWLLPSYRESIHLYGHPPMDSDGVTPAHEGVALPRRPHPPRGGNSTASRRRPGERGRRAPAGPRFLLGAWALLSPPPGAALLQLLWAVTRAVTQADGDGDRRAGAATPSPSPSEQSMGPAQHLPNPASRDHVEDSPGHGQQVALSPRGRGALRS